MARGSQGIEAAAGIGERAMSETPPVWKYQMAVACPGGGTFLLDATLRRENDAWIADCDLMGTAIQVVHPAKERAMVLLMDRVAWQFATEHDAMEEEGDAHAS